MPYDAISDLPDQTSDLTNEQKRRFLAAFNSAYEAGKGKESAFRIAWAAAKNAKSGEVDKHLKGKHDQADHGSWAREKKLLGGSKMMDKKKVEEVKQQIHGNTVEETIENANQWLLDQFDKGDRIEHAVVVDDDGTPLDVIMGVEGAVAIPGKKKESWHQKIGLTQADLKNAHVTHLHPNAGDGKGMDPLSPADFIVALGQRASSITAVTPNGTSSVTFSPPSGKRQRMKWANQVLDAVSQYEAEWDKASLALMATHTGRDPSGLEGSVVARLREAWGSMRDFRRMDEEDKKEVVSDANKEMDRIAHDVFNQIEGVEYQSNLRNLVTSKSEVSKDRVTIEIPEYKRQDGTKVQEHERRVQRGSKAHERAKDEGRVADGSGDGSGGGFSTGTIAAAAGAGIMLLGAGIAGARLRGVRSTPTEAISDVITDFRPTQGPTHGFSAQQISDHASLVNSGRVSELPGKSRHFLDNAISEWQISSQPMRSYYETGSTANTLGFSSPTSAQRAYDYFTDAIAFAPPESPTLYRGMSLKNSSDFTRFTTPGNRITMGPSSFSSEHGMATSFMRGGGQEIMFRLSANSRALNIEGIGSAAFRHEREWITGGEFIVRSVDRTSLPWTVVDIEQTGSLVSRAFSSTAAVVKGMDWFGNLHESATALSDRPTMSSMDWSSPDGVEALREMVRLGNFPGWYAKRLHEVNKNRVWVDEHTRNGQTVEGHYRSVTDGVKNMADDTAPVADLGVSQQNVGQSAARAGAYSGIGAGALALGRHYLSRRPTLGAAYGLYGLANLFGAGHQAHQAYQAHQGVQKIQRVTSREDFDEFMAALSEQTGDSPENIIEGFGQWLQAKKEPPTSVTKEHFKRYLTEVYGQGREKTSKHLIGRHDQQDHNPHKDRVREVDGQTGFEIRPGDDRLPTPHTRDEHKGLLRRSPTMMDRFREHRAEVKERQTREAGEAVGLDPDSPEFFRELGDLGRSLGVVSDDDLSKDGEVIFQEDVERIASAAVDANRVQKDEKSSGGRVWVDDHERDGQQVEGHWRIVDQAVGAVAEHGDRVPLIGEQLQDRARRTQISRDMQAITENLPSMSPEQRERAERVLRSASQYVGDRARRLPSDAADAVSETADVVGERRQERDELAQAFDQVSEERERQSRKQQERRQDAQEQWG